MSTMHQINMAVGDGGAVHMPPKEAVYSDLLSLGVSARKSHVEFPSQAGGQYIPSSRNVIEIPISVGDGQWVDFSNHYIKMKIVNTSTATNGIDAKQSVYYTAHDFIQRLQILGTNSELLEDVTDYNKLCRMLQIHQLDTSDVNTQKNLGGFKTPGTTPILSPQLVNGQTIAFQLVSGVLNAQKYFPLGMARNRSLTIRIEIAPAAIAIATVSNDAAPAAGLATDKPNYTIEQVSLGCDVISMSDSYNMKFRSMLEQMGSINIHYTTYKGYQTSTTDAETAGSIIVPDSSRSLKSIFTVFNTAGLGVNVDALALKNPALTRFIYNVNSHSYPSANLQINSVAGQLNTAASFALLHTALGGISSSKIITANYNTFGFAIGVCTESFNRSSNVLESGENLSQSSNPIRLNFSKTTVAGGGSTTAYTFTLSDRLISFDASGSLTSSG